ncbi:MAG TPA: trypsin-like peptidase domain-containing protein [Gaiellaceae bacterium]|nr:trypsin-like peptidase domain-containing protein [Gaiellaceae bacterium]
MGRILVIVLAATVAGAIAGGIVGATLDNGDAATTITATSPTPIVSVASQPRRGLTAEQIYRNDAPGVVVITDTQTQSIPPTFFAPGGKQQVGALGSGFVIDKQGNILTNDHVVQGATNIRVGFTGGASSKATIVGSDPSSDLAVIRVNAPSSALHPLSFGDVAAMQVGDPVYAIGNPFGLDRTMTAGIVSATGRDIQSPNGLTIPNAIQTDAPINHGNSGGPLLDRYGRVVGVNAQIQGGTVNANVGVGFAISAATAKSVAEQLIGGGRVKHAWLGVEVATIDPSLAGVVRGLPSNGVVVARVVKGSPAAKAGLSGATRQVTVNGVTMPLGGDTIVALDGKSLTSSTQLADAVAQHKPGDKLKLEVVRGGAKRTVQVRLGNAPQ